MHSKHKYYQDVQVSRFRCLPELHIFGRFPYLSTFITLKKIHVHFVVPCNSPRPSISFVTVTSDRGKQAEHQSRLKLCADIFLSHPCVTKTTTNVGFAFVKRLV